MEMAGGMEAEDRGIPGEAVAATDAAAPDAVVLTRLGGGDL